MITNYKIVLFAYNFPHRKTVDYINILYNQNIKITLILAAEHIPIHRPKSLFTSPKKKVSKKAKDLAEIYKIPYFVVKHNSEKSYDLIKKYNINFGIISGARILNSKIISLVKNGILNLHPGLLPEIRGLDSILWSIFKNKPLGVTAHLINEKIDSGLLVVKDKIKIDKNDSIYDLFVKIYQLQLDLLPISLTLISKHNKLPALSENKNYNSYMSYNTQLKLKNMIQIFIQKHSRL